MVQMKFNTWAVPREVLFWLNVNEVAVLTVDDSVKNGHCEILDTVS